MEGQTIANYPNYLFYPDGRLWSKTRMRYLKTRQVAKKGEIGYMLCHNKQGKNFSVIDLLQKYYPNNPLPDLNHLKSFLSNPNAEDLEDFRP